MTLKQSIGKWLFSRLPITRFLFDQLRVELNSLLVWFLNLAWPPQRRKLARIRRADDVRLNVACGPQSLPGFINLDLFSTADGVIRWDCRHGLPLSDNTALGIRMEQFLEHFETREELPRFLKESWRVLKPGGVLRIIVPDARRYIEAYLRPDLSGFKELNFPVPFPEDLPTRMDVLSHIFHQEQEHRWGYDFENLKHRLETAGFKTITKAEYRKSADPELACDREVHAPYSLYVEAVK